MTSSDRTPPVAPSPPAVMPEVDRVDMAAITLVGPGFETAMILTIAALSTTGPLAQVAGEAPIFYDTLTDGTRVILALAMVLGRLETLAFIALFDAGFWRE